MGARHTRLAAALAAAWEAEVVSARTLTALADVSTESRVKARLLVLSAFCRAHASRLLARLAALGRGPLPVPPAELTLDDDLRTALLREAVAARTAAQRYDTMAELARRESDLSSAWVCELNRSEENDRAAELIKLAQGGTEVRPEVSPEAYGLGV